MSVSYCPIYCLILFLKCKCPDKKAVDQKRTTISNLDSAEEIGSVGNVGLDNGVLLALTTLKLLLLSLSLRNELQWR